MCGAPASRRLPWLPVLLLVAPVLGPAGVPVFSARAVAVASPRPARHSRGLQALVRALAAGGHQVISHFPHRQRSDNCTGVSLANSTEQGGIQAPCEVVRAGVPNSGDQVHSAASLTSHSVVIILTVSQLNEHSVRDALQRLINDNRYRKRMKELSAVFWECPLEDNWVENVTRHRGAPHLRCAALHLPGYQHLPIHVAAVALLTVLLALMSVYAGLRWILGPFLVGSIE